MQNPTNILMKGFKDLGEKIQELTENRKKPQLARAILRGEHSRGITISKLKLYYIDSESNQDSLGLAKRQPGVAME